MKRIVFSGVVVLSMLTGCVPTRIVWSPDGEKAVVLGEDGMYLTNQEGKLTQIWKYGTGGSTTAPATTQPVKGVREVVSAVWFGDSRRLVLCTVSPVDSWSDLAFLPAEQQKDLARRFKIFEKEILAGRKMEKVIDELNKGLTNKEPAILRLYLAAHASASAMEKITGAGDQLKGGNIDVFRLQIFTLEGQTLKPSTLLTQTVNQVLDLRLSSNGKYLAFTEKGAKSATDDLASTLKVASIEERPVVRLVDEPTNWYPDWSSDGRSLFYIKSANGPRISLGSVTRTTICDSQGKLLKQFSSEDLAGLVFSTLLRVRCLADGRVLFSGLAVTLPCTVQDMPERLSLFTLDPGRYSRVIPVIPAQSEWLPTHGLEWFEPSPDGRWVCIPGKDGGVSVLKLASGEVLEPLPVTEIPNGRSDKIKLATVPVWRNSEELCFAVPAGSAMGSAKRAEVVVYSVKEKKARCISKGWPERLVRAFGK